MNPAPIPRSERRRLWGFVLGGLVGTVLLVVVGLYHLFTLSNEATVLRRAIFTTTSAQPELRVQGSVGSILLGVAGVVLRFVPDVPTEARQALAAVNSGSVGVYELRALPTPEERVAVFVNVDEAMRQRGWMRIVGVNHAKESVVIYAPTDESTGRQLRICLAVCDRKQLVIASIRVDAQKLGTLLEDQFSKFHRTSLVAEKKKS